MYQPELRAFAMSVPKRSWKWPVFSTLLTIALVASNVASVLSESFHDALFKAVSAQIGAMFPSQKARLLSGAPKVRAATRVAGLNKKLTDSTKQLTAMTARQARTAEALTTSRAQVAAARKRLASKEAKLLARGRDMAAMKANISRRVKAFRSFRGVAVRRLVRSKGVNMLSLPVRTVPFAGAALAVGVAAYEINSDCAMMSDIRILANQMGVDDAHENEEVICGMSIPSSISLGEVRAEARQALKELNPFQAWWEAENQKQKSDFDLDESWKKYWRSTCLSKKDHWYQCVF